MEASNWSEPEFKVMVIRMLNGRKIKHSNHKKGPFSRLDEAEDWISNLEHKVEKNTQSEQQKEKRILKDEDNVRDFCDNMKCNNMGIIGVGEGEEREQGIEKFLNK